MNLKTITYVALLMLISANLNAVTLDEYQVEILLFKQKNISVNESEIFEKNILIPNNAESLSLPTFELLETDETDLAISGEESEQSRESEEVDYDEITTIHSASNILIQLNDIKRSIKRSSYYKVLKHTAWRQLGLDNENAKRIHITQGDAFVVLNNTVDEDVVNIAFDHKYLLEQWENFKKEDNIAGINKPKIEPLLENDDDDDGAIEDASIPSDLLDYFASINLTANIVYPLDGTVKVVRTRYLHMYTDLLWTIVLPKKVDESPIEELLLAKDESPIEEPLLLKDESPVEESLLIKDDYQLDIDNLQDELESVPDTFIETLENLNLQSYSFKSHRKMRSKKQHYIDHPKLGLVTIIMPVLHKKE